MMELLFGLVMVAVILLALLVSVYAVLMVYEEIKEEINLIRREKENERRD